MKRIPLCQRITLALAVMAWMIAITGFVYGNYGSAGSLPDPRQQLLASAVIMAFGCGVGALPAATALLIALWQMAHTPRTKTLYTALMLGALYFLFSSVLFFS